MVIQTYTRAMTYCSLNETVSVEPDTEDHQSDLLDHHSDLLEQDISMDLGDSPDRSRSNIGVRNRSRNNIGISRKELLRPKVEI